MNEWDKELDDLLKEMGAEGSPIDVIHKRLNKEFDKKLNIGFIGSPGIGKSTLMNKIAGEKIADAGINPGVKVTQYTWGENDSIVFWDLPGYNGLPEEHSVENYWEEYNIGHLDLIICMFTAKLNQHDKHFFLRAMENAQDVIFVRSKSDDLYDEELTEEELKLQYKETIEREFGSQHKLLFISARKGYENTLSTLQEEIKSKLGKELQEKYIRNAKAYSKSFLDAKEKASLKTVLLYSTLSAGAGAVPVAGIAIDIPANIKMVKQIGENFNLTDARLKLLEDEQISNIEDYNIYIKLLQQAGKNLIPIYKPMLEKLVPQLAGKSFAKVIPIAGAGVGFALTFASGKTAINNCRTIAEKVMDIEIAEKVN